MAETCSHQDESRKTVSVTAHGVAWIKALDSIKHPDNLLYNDPYAAKLAGELGKQWVAEMDERYGVENILVTIPMRTKYIDGEIMRLLGGGIHQHVTLGAGLDARPWRLTAPHEVDYFEVDFPELFNFKLPLIEAEGAVTSFRYHSVTADMSLPDWGDKLQTAGFDVHKPTVWLVEGLTMYLTDEENTIMFQKIASLSAAGSHIIVCVFGEEAARRFPYDLFRFNPPKPLQWMENCLGWKGIAKDMADAALEVGRFDAATAERNRGYDILTMSK